jgi:thiol-disulfide isomerase/thioredoxin
MKKIISLFALILTTFSCSQAQKKEFSAEALNYELTDSNNTKVTFKSILKKHKGKKIVIEVWAGWCSDCIKAMPKLKELQANNPDVVYVFISADKTFEKWNEALKKYELNGEQYWINDEKLMKGAFGKSIDLDWIPRYIVLDKKGTIVIYRAIETDFEKINEELKK